MNRTRYKRLGRFKGSVSRQLSLAFVGLSLACLAAQPAELPSFTDRREEAGITFKHHASPTREKYLIETMGGGVAVFDYDNDGRLDVLFVNSGNLKSPGTPEVDVDRSDPAYFNRLYRNMGGQTFTDVTAEAGLEGATHGYGMGVATGDFDNDGFVDLYVTNLGSNVLYRNQGDGTFEDVTAKAGVAGGGWSVSAGFFDYDQDGSLDLFVARYLDWDFSKHKRCGKTIPVYCTPKEFGPVDNLLFHNNGDGTFTDVSEPAGIAGVLGKALGVAFNDFDADGWLDIAVANDSVAQLLFRNNADGTFTEQALETGFAYNEDGGSYSGMGVDFNDYNNDGRPDIVVTNLAKELYALYRNDGGLFTYRTRQTNLARITNFMSGWGTRFFDYDHDGWKDLFVAQSHVLDNVGQMSPDVVYKQPPLLARNVDGKFFDVSRRSGAVFEQDLAGRGAAFGDLDNDGDIDVVMAVLDNAPWVLYNNAAELESNWIQIEFAGAQSNRQGLGASVRLKPVSGGGQWSYATTAGSYLSANDHRVHFGLGSSDALEWIEILWPSGVTQRIENVKANQILTATEPPISASQQ